MDWICAIGGKYIKMILHISISGRCDLPTNTSIEYLQDLLNKTLTEDSKANLESLRRCVKCGDMIIINISHESYPTYIVNKDLDIQLLGGYKYNILPRNLWYLINDVSGDIVTISEIPESCLIKAVPESIELDLLNTLDIDNRFSKIENAGNMSLFMSKNGHVEIDKKEYKGKLGVLTI